MPTLQPRGNPKFFPVKTSSAHGNFSFMREAESSVEPLSTTMTFRFSYVRPSSEERQVEVSLQLFQFSTIMCTLGLKTRSRTFPVYGLRGSANGHLSDPANNEYRAVQHARLRIPHTSSASMAFFACPPKVPRRRGAANARQSRTWSSSQGNRPRS